MAQFLGAAALVLFLSAAASGLVFPEVCRSHEGVPNFNVSRYQGGWYQLKRYQSDITIGGCTTFEFKATNASMMRMIMTEMKNGRFREVSAYGAAQSNGTFAVKLNGTDVNFSVLSTNYTSYALLWSCANVNASSSSQNLWVLSRTPTLSAADSAEVNRTITSKNLNYTLLQPVTQDKHVCFSGSTISTLSLLTIVLAIFAKTL